jgi:murein DD-endopeptidase MepM/ murein hydrolase activator NlpD
MNLTPLSKFRPITMHTATALVLSLLLSGCGWVSVDPDKSASAPPPPGTGVNAGPVVSAVPGGRSVLVQAGDSVYGIANRYGATPRQMIALNNLRPPFEIQAGQRLLLPPEQQLYTVRPGDTVNGLAAAYNTDPEALARLNHLPPPYVLHAGSQVGIPIARAPRAVVAARPAAPPPVRRQLLDAPAQRQELPAPVKVMPPKPLPQARSAAPPRIPPPPPARVAAAPPPPVATPPQPVEPRANPSRLPPKRPPELAAAPPPPKPPVSKPAPARIQPTEPRRPPPVQRGLAAAKPGSSGGFLAPVEGPVIAKFGKQADGRRNDGVNIAAARGTPVRASRAGEVVYAGDALQGYGKLLLVKHAGGWVTAYAHLDRILAQRGDKVARGQTVGVVGTSGGVSAPQLHFEMRKDNKPVNPSGKLAAR